MKIFACTLAFAMSFISNTQAQKFGYHKPSNGLKTAGIVTCSAGAVVALMGLYDYTATGDTGGKGSNSTTSVPQNNEGLIIAAVGGGLMVTGVVLVVAGVSRNNRSRIGIIAPKRNEVGLAYNF